MSLSIDLSEMNTLAVDLGKAVGSAVAQVSTVVRKTAFDIERDAKIFAPVDTGNLRNSISTTAVALSAEIGPTAAYGAYVEYGTSRQAPAAYMGPAFDRHAHIMETAIGIIGERSII